MGWQRDGDGVSKSTLRDLMTCLSWKRRVAQADHVIPRPRVAMCKKVKRVRELLKGTR